MYKVQNPSKSEEENLVKYGSDIYVSEMTVLLGMLSDISAMIFIGCLVRITFTLTGHINQ
jgi:hypothetical protein